jgi:plasmid stabilization system protein ParE
MAEVVLHPEAQREYRASALWYRHRNPTAARRFVAEFDRVVTEIAGHPERYGWYDDEFREAVMHRFPYRVVDRVEPTGNVLVVAVAHASREPGYWRSRA